MDRQGILQKLADKEISREEAERLLAEQEEVPLETPPPPQPVKKRNTGCLIALIVAVVLIPLLLVLGWLCFLYRGVRWEQSAVRAEVMVGTQKEAARRAAQQETTAVQKAAEAPLQRGEE